MNMPRYTTGFARHADESEAPGLWRGLVGAWLPFLGPTGLTLRDWSGHQNHGTLTNMDPATDWVPGKDGYALDFDDTDDFVAILGNEDVRFTMSLWFKSRDVTLEPILGIAESPGNGTTDKVFFFDTNSKLRFYIWDGAQKIVESATTMVVNTWYHGAVTYDGTTLRLYVDGSEDGTLSAGNPFTGYATPELIIGYINSAFTSPNMNDAYYNGLIGDVRIYNRALSANEVAHLYADPYAMFRVAQIPLWYVAAVANDLLLLPGNLRGNLQELRGGLV